MPPTIISTDLGAAVSALAGADCFAYDSETTGVGIRRKRCVGISLAASGQVFWLRMLSDHPENPKLYSVEEIREALTPAFTCSDKLCVGHNLVFDVVVLKRLGIDFQCQPYDTMLAAFALDENRREMWTGLNPLNYQLKSLSLELLGIRQPTFAETLGEYPSIKSVPQKRLTLYAGADAYLTLRLYEVLNPMLMLDPGRYRNFIEIEMPILPVIASMQWDGIGIDEERIAIEAEALRQELTNTEAEIFRLAGRRYDLTQRGSLKHLLFRNLGFTARKWTRSGEIALDDDALNRIYEDEPHRVIQQVQKRRKITDLLARFFNSYHRYVHPVTGRVHAGYLMTMTDSGRFSASRPNVLGLTNDKRVRRCIVPGPSLDSWWDTWGIWILVAILVLLIVAAWRMS